MYRKFDPHRPYQTSRLKVECLLDGKLPFPLPLRSSFTRNTQKIRRRTRSNLSGNAYRELALIVRFRKQLRFAN